MKFSGHIIINKDRFTVVNYFKNPKYLREYQDGFIRKDFISGKEGENGAISKIYYQHGKQEMELTETITANNLPNTFEAFYHHKHMDNTMKCTFTEVAKNVTRYDYEFEYTRINWVMPRLMAILFTSMFKKPAAKWMRQFKEFVEKQ